MRRQMLQSLFALLISFLFMLRKIQAAVSRIVCSMDMLLSELGVCVYV